MRLFDELHVELYSRPELLDLFGKALPALDLPREHLQSSKLPSACTTKDLYQTAHTTLLRISFRLRDKQADTRQVHCHAGSCCA